MPHTLRLLGVMILAVIGQFLLTDPWLFQHEYAIWGIFCFGLAVFVFAWTLYKDKLLGAARAHEAHATDLPITIRWWWLGLAAVTGAHAFYAAEGNQFRPSGLLAWVISIGTWLAATWEGPATPTDWRKRVEALWHADAITLRVTRSMLLLLLILLIGGYFRFAHLDTIPLEMTSDHVEKLRDVNDILTQKPYVFLERNTGREPMQFYAAALVSMWFGTGMTHLTLKIVTATAGLLLLPFVYLLGREIEDENLGLWAMLLTAISFWATSISRVGLRFPLSPLFVAASLYFLLRGLRRGTRNDFLCAGLFLGIGLYGYSPIRVFPLLIIVIIAWYMLWPKAQGERIVLLMNALLLSTTAFMVFLPLLRYAVSKDNGFWARTLSRLSETEDTIQGSPLVIFLQNQWNALRMFNWRGDTVWVNTIPTMPALDFISGALFVLGIAYVIARLLRRRDKAAGVLLMALPILMLPSTLSLAFPNENPSLVRTSGAIPIVFLIAAYPLWLMFKRPQTGIFATKHYWSAMGAVVVLVGLAAGVNYDLYFHRYAPQYTHAAENYSEIGHVIRNFAHSIGTYDTVYVVAYPYWVDTRVLGITAEQFHWNQAICQHCMFPDIANVPDDPRIQLFILHQDDHDALAALQMRYREGALSTYHSTVPDHDFLMFVVPGVLTLEQSSFLPEP